jgi:hypothetical protein
MRSTGQAARGVAAARLTRQATSPPRPQPPGCTGDAQAGSPSKEAPDLLRVRPGATVATCPPRRRCGRPAAGCRRCYVRSPPTGPPPRDNQRKNPELRPQLPHEAVRGNSPRMASAKVGSQPPAGLSGRREVPNRRKETPRPAWPSRDGGTRGPHGAYHGGYRLEASGRREVPGWSTPAGLAFAEVRKPLGPH